jgi:FeS assembly SUF system protein
MPQSDDTNVVTDVNALRERVVEVLHTCYDPEIPVDIFELGLVYDIAVDDAGKVEIKMTLTSPACPVAGSLPPEVENKVRSIAGVSDSVVEVVWEPPWNPGMMSEAAKLELGFM